MSGLSRAIDAVMSCLKCGALGVDTCACWEKCSCGWRNSPGEFCRNPETQRCSSKMKYGVYNRRTKQREPRR